MRDAATGSARAHESEPAQFLEDEIRGIVSDVWTMILSLEVEPAPPPAPQPGTRTLSGLVQISGAWEGVVSLACTQAHARRAAAIMFGLAEEQVALEHLLDALGELTNMVGGNVKALLPGPSRLSLPAVAEGADYTLQVHDRRRVITRVDLACLREPVCVSLLRSGDA